MAAAQVTLVGDVPLDIKRFLHGNRKKDLVLGCPGRIIEGQFYDPWHNNQHDQGEN
jgi:hypothetical protein